MNASSAEFAFARGEPFEQLPVRQVADRPETKQGAKLPGRDLLPDCHVFWSYLR